MINSPPLSHKCHQVPGAGRNRCKALQLIRGREDAGFHAYQMLEAGGLAVRQRDNTDAGRHILIAVARYLAAHSPTERAALQTADIARRLMRGGELHHEEGASSC